MRQHLIPVHKTNVRRTIRHLLSARPLSNTLAACLSCRETRIRRDGKRNGGIDLQENVTAVNSERIRLAGSIEGDQRTMEENDRGLTEYSKKRLTFWANRFLRI